MTRSLGELDLLYRTGAPEARLDAVKAALAQKELWEPAKRWGGLFLRWARAEDMPPRVCDILGPKLIGPLWLSGDIEARQLVALSLWPKVWPWRAGLTALCPSLERDDTDWPLFEQFAKACAEEESRFGQERQAYNGLLRALRCARAGCAGRAAGWVDRHEPTLPGFVVAGFRQEASAEDLP